MLGLGLRGFRVHAAYSDLGFCALTDRLGFGKVHLPVSLNIYTRQLKVGPGCV